MPFKQNKRLFESCTRIEWATLNGLQVALLITTSRKKSLRMIFIYKHIFFLLLF